MRNSYIEVKLIKEYTTPVIRTKYKQGDPLLYASHNVVFNLLHYSIYECDNSYMACSHVPWHLICMLQCHVCINEDVFPSKCGFGIATQGSS